MRVKHLGELQYSTVQSYRADTVRFLVQCTENIWPLNVYLTIAYLLDNPPMTMKTPFVVLRLFVPVRLRFGLS